MIFQANLQEAVRSLVSAKQRTLLALIGIVIGIGAVIAMVTVGKIVELEAMRQFQELGTDLVSIEKSGNTPFKLAEVQALPQSCAAISVVAPFTLGGGGEAFHRGKAIERTNFTGVTPAFQAMNKLHVTEGRFIADLDAFSPHIVIGAEIAQALQQAGSTRPVGQLIRIGERVYTVVGVLDRVLQSGARRFDPNVLVLVHVSTALRQPGVDISVINARVRPGHSNAQAGEQVLQYFGKRAPTLEVRVSSPEDLIAQMARQMQMFTLLLGAIGGISLVVGGVGVMNVMLVSVSERRREIGIRRALGARRGDIRQQFLLESVILTLIGGLGGVALGVGAARLVCHFADWQFVLSWPAIVVGVGVSSVVGVFFGFYPARQASLLDPIVALRSD